MVTSSFTIISWHVAPKFMYKELDGVHTIFLKPLGTVPWPSYLTSQLKFFCRDFKDLPLPGQVGVLID